MNIEKGKPTERRQGGEYDLTNGSDGVLSDLKPGSDLVNEERGREEM